MTAGDKDVAKQQNNKDNMSRGNNKRPSLQSVDSFDLPPPPDLPPPELPASGGLLKSLNEEDCDEFEIIEPPEIGGGK